jgi:hypothetical protein
MATDKCIKIDGTHYRAVPEMFMLDELDELARFFLEEVLPVEKKIEYLLEIFGLPSRTVEDILADLLKQNRISLRLETGEVDILDRPPLRRHHRAGLPVDIWQDDSTGALLPLRMVAENSQKKEMEEVAHLKSVKDDSTGFLELADSQILAMLAPVDPGMRISTEGWMPERLREKAKISSYPIYVPLETATVDNFEVRFANAPRLPLWLIKLWSREMAGDQHVRNGDLDEALSSAILESESIFGKEISKPESVGDVDRDLANLESADASILLKRWANAMADVFECDADWRALLNRLHRADKRLQSLEGRKAFRGTFQLVEAPAVCHVTELWRQTARSLVLVTNEWTPELMQRVAAVTVGLEDRDAHLILVECSEGQRSRSLPPIKETFLKTCGGEVEFLSIQSPSSLSFCAADGRIGRLGNLRNVLLTTSPAIEVTGLGAIEALYSPVVRRVDAKGGGRWFLSQFQNAGEPDEGNSPDGDKLRQLIGKMHVLHDDIRLRIQALADDTRLAASARGNSEAGTEISANSFRDIEPSFPVRCDELFGEWEGVELTIPQMTDSAQQTFTKFCRWVSASDRQHELEIFLAGVPVNATRALAKILVRALNAGARITLHLTHPASKKSRARLESIFQEAIRHPRFLVTYVHVQLPSILIADEMFVAISSGNWLRDVRADDYGFVVHSPGLARSLLRLAAAKRSTENEFRTSDSEEV